RFVLSDRGLSSSGDRLMRGDAAVLLFSPDAQASGSSIGYRVAPGEQATLYVAWLLHPETVSSWLHVDERSYLDAREQVARFWEDRLSQGATFNVPDQRVMDAERNLLIQELTLT